MKTESIINNYQQFKNLDFKGAFRADYATTYVITKNPDLRNRFAIVVFITKENEIYALRENLASSKLECISDCDLRMIAHPLFMDYFNFVILKGELEGTYVISSIDCDCEEFPNVEQYEQYIECDIKSL